MAPEDIVEDHDSPPHSESSPDSELHEMSAEEALEKIREGVALQNVTIHGLALNGAFSEPITMRRVTLVKPTFDRVRFDKHVGLFACDLVRPKIRRAEFLEGFEIKGTHVKAFSMQDTEIVGPFRADGIVSDGHWSVKEVKFSGLVRFWEAGFKGWVDFNECTFGDTADLRSMECNEGVGIRKCTFAGDVLLRGASVQKKLDFSESRFEKVLDLSKAKLHDFVYLEDIHQGPGQTFAVNNAVADKIRIHVDQIAGRLQSEQSGEHAQAVHEYGLLKHNFASLHRYEAEDWAFYRFKVNSRLAAPNETLGAKLTRFGSWLFLDLGCGYGTSPGRAIRSALVIMVTFALIYLVGFHKFENVARFIGDDPDALGNRLVFSVVESVSVFTAGLAGDQLHEARGWVLIPLAIEAVLGTLLWGLFIVAFGRKVIR